MTLASITLIPLSESLINISLRTPKGTYRIVYLFNCDPQFIVDDKIKAKYEGETYIVQEGFEFKNESYERQSNGKGELVNRGSKKILPIKYTPDFVSSSFIIECKGRANESFPIRWKMFKKHVKEHLKRVTLYKPQNQKECDQVIELITNKIK